MRSMGVARRNILDGVSFVQVAEGALVEVGDIIHRTRELALQAANGTLTLEDREILESERAELADEALRIFNSTKFGGIEVFGGGTSSVSGGLRLQIGPSSEDVLRVSASDTVRVGIALPNLSVINPDRAGRAIRVLDVATQLISEARGQLGATQLRLESAGRSLAAREENTSAALSRKMDVDFAVETAELTRLEILQSASLSVLAQSNLQPSLALQLLRGPGPEVQPGLREGQ